MSKKFIIMMIIILIGVIAGSIFVIINVISQDDEGLVFTNDEESQYLFFEDIPESHWASIFINFLAERNIIDVNESNFYPEKMASKIDFYKMVMKSSVAIANGENIEDAEVIDIMKDLGIIEEDITVEKTNSSLTNYDAAIILGKIDLLIRKNEQKIVSINNKYLDSVNEIDRTIIEHAISSGFFNTSKMTTFYPNKILNRAEMSEVLYFFINN